ncbi:MAG: ABC transporter ATP-binding protein [Nitrososphaerota archaeon]
MSSIIEIDQATKEFVTKRGLLKRTTNITRALDRVTLTINENEIFGLIGESGSGKTTLGLAMLRLIGLNGGKIYFGGEDIFSLKKKQLFNFREKAQMIFQDPYGSLNPVLTVYKSVSTPLKAFHKEMSEEEVLDKVIKTLERVGLTPVEQFLNKFPTQMSGGQRQRVGIARAVISDPEFIVADEPVSMLDVSLRADILNILIDLKLKLKKSIMFISHDIAVTQYVSDRIAVMHLGQIVEMAGSREIIKNPLHPYTKTLIDSIPVPDPNKKWNADEIVEQISEYTNEGKNECSYANKCPFVKSVCREKRPDLKEVEKNHFVACVLYD